MKGVWVVHPPHSFEQMWLYDDAKKLAAYMNKNPDTENHDQGQLSSLAASSTL